MDQSACVANVLVDHIEAHVAGDQRLVFAAVEGMYGCHDETMGALHNCVLLRNTEYTTGF